MKNQGTNENNQELQFIPVDLAIHHKYLKSLSLEYFYNMASEIKNHYHTDLKKLLPGGLGEYIETHISNLTACKPPDGIYLLVNEGNNFIGMGAIRRLRDNIGEIKRIFISPQYRRKGYGKKLLQELLTQGESFGIKTFLLDVAPFFKVAQNLYRSFGFYQREKNPETEVPPEFQDVWIYMEKKVET